MEEIIELLYEISKNAQWLLGLITIVALIGASVVFGSKSARFSSIRASVKRLQTSLDRSSKLLRELRESSERLETGVDDIEGTARSIKDRAIEAEVGIEQALDLLRRLQSGDDNEDSSGDGS